MNNELYMKERFGISKLIDDSFNDLKPDINVIKSVRELLIERLKSAKDVNELLTIILAFYSYTKKYKVFSFLDDFYIKSFNDYLSKINDYSQLIELFNSDSRVLDDMIYLMDINYLDFMREYGVHFNINKMLSSEIYANRLQNGGLTLFEIIIFWDDG